MNPKKEHLAAVVAVLEFHSQRATYSAVGGVVGLPAQSVMQGEAKSQRNSWVVSVRTGEPSGYDKKECSPLLKRNSEVIRTRSALADWLKGRM